MNAMTTKGFRKSGKVKRIPLKPSRTARPASDDKISPAGEGSSERRNDPMNMMTTIEPARVSIDEVSSAICSPQPAIGAKLALFPGDLSPALRELLVKWQDAYCQTCVPSDDDAPQELHDAVETAAYEIADFSACTVGDVAAKLAVAAFDLNGAGTVHRPGITDDNRLLIREQAALDYRAEAIFISAAQDAARLAGMVVRKYEWARLLANYRAAKAAEDDYDQHVWRPQWNIFIDGGPNIDHSASAEIERLQSLRSEAEDLLMACPSPDANSFAMKYLIAHGNDRETDGWNEMLDAEARHFSEVQQATSRPVPAERSDAALVDAWADYAAGAQLLYIDDNQTAAEREAQACLKIDPADKVICNTAAVGLAGIAVKLRRAITDVCDERWLEEAIINGDDATLQTRASELDYQARLVAEAILALEELGKGDADPHRGWLAERDGLLLALNSLVYDASEDTEKAASIVCRAQLAVEKRIFEGPARTHEGSMIKLLVLSQMIAAGHDPSAEMALPIVEEAANLIGSRTLESMGAA